MRALHVTELIASSTAPHAHACCSAYLVCGDRPLERMEYSNLLLNLMKIKTDPTAADRAYWHHVAFAHGLSHTSAGHTGSCFKSLTPLQAYHVCVSKSVRMDAFLAAPRLRDVAAHCATHLFLGASLLPLPCNATRNRHSPENCTCRQDVCMECGTYGVFPCFSEAILWMV